MVKDYRITAVYPETLWWDTWRGAYRRDRHVVERFRLTIESIEAVTNWAREEHPGAQSITVEPNDPFARPTGIGVG
jgi:hypothetical protein